MAMKRLTVLALFLALALISNPAAAQDNLSDPDDLGFATFHDRTTFLMSSPGSLKFGLYGFGNPAMTATLHQPDLLFQWSDDGGFTEFNQWGLFGGIPNLGFGVDNRTFGGVRQTDYRLSTGFGNQAASFGVGLGWYGGDIDLDTHFTVGTLLRPNRYLSLGLIGTRSFERADYEGVADLGIRPLGDERLALFGEFAVNTAEGFDDPTWSAGASVEPLAGVRVTARYTGDVGFTTGLQFSLGRSGVRSQAHFDTDANQQFNTYGIRLGAYDRNLRDTRFAEEDTYLNLNLEGAAPHQRSRLFDLRETHFEKLDALEQARHDPRIAGVVVDATEIGMSQGKVWEVYDALQTLRDEGKTVILYAERGGMNMLHLIAAADKVVMDPQGSLSIPGYVSGNTYLADLLETVGIGVDEFREMEYKSAFEIFSRTEMSEADREQRQALIDGFYDLVQRNVTGETELSENEFDELIDDGLSMRAPELVDANIVDRLARPDDLDDIIEEVEGQPTNRIGRTALIPYQEPGDDRWGPRSEIGLLYAIGPTQTDAGIRARTLAREIRTMRDRRNMEAMVLRVDSPGGDVLASDLVAEEMEKTAEEMPVIVSMGDLAASGGYWISMYADSILALPNTVTGSIGVIGGWFYDEEFSENVRLATDRVQRGESADATFGPTLPLVGLTLPGRDLTEEERDQLVGNLNAVYDDFLENVADGRDLDVDEVREVAAGRVWTGEDALEAQLVDELGSLNAAVQMAREAADIPEDEPIDIREGPEPPLFQLPSLLALVGLTDAQEPDEADLIQEYIEMMIEHNGEPMAVLPFEYVLWHYQMNKQN